MSLLYSFHIGKKNSKFIYTSFQVGNIFFLDTFLNGAFLKYGTDVIKFSGMDQENRTDPMIIVFPRVTKCTFHKFGPSGSIQTHDALCILALNILNEKIFIFLWFWLIILSTLSGLALLYSSMLIVLPSVREIVLKHRFRFGSPTGVPSLIRKTQVSIFFFFMEEPQKQKTRKKKF